LYFEKATLLDMTGSGHSYQRSEASLPRLAEGDETDDLDDDKNEDAAAARSTSTSTIGSDDRAYDWRLYIPVRKTWGALCRWMIVGGAAKANLTEAQVQKNIHSLARCLVLLREYADHFGLPPKGGPQDQEFVLREVFRDLYLGGAPIWALESVMQKVSSLGMERIAHLVVEGHPHRIPHACCCHSHTTAGRLLGLRRTDGGSGH
jgi:hypothetical protein